MLRIAINEAGEDGKPKLRAVAEALVNKAIEGDVMAIREIGDRLDGKPTQSITGPGGGPIQTVDLTNATSEQLDALEQFFTNIAGPGDSIDGDPVGEGAPQA